VVEFCLLCWQVCRRVDAPNNSPRVAHTSTENCPVVDQHKHGSCSGGCSINSKLWVLELLIAEFRKFDQVLNGIILVLFLFEVGFCDVNAVTRYVLPKSAVSVKQCHQNRVSVVKI
jgi:hypothetical protein